MLEFTTYENSDLEVDLSQVRGPRLPALITKVLTDFLEENDFAQAARLVRISVHEHRELSHDVIDAIQVLLPSARVVVCNKANHSVISEYPIAGSKAGDHG